MPIREARRAAKRPHVVRGALCGAHCCALQGAHHAAPSKRSELRAACFASECGGHQTSSHVAFDGRLRPAYLRCVRYAPAVPLQRATCGMLTRDMQCAMCSSATCNMQRAAAQHATCSSAIRNVLHFMLRHAACDIQHTTCSMQHAADSTQHGECCLAPFSLRPPTHPSCQTHFHRDWRTGRGCTGCHRHYWYSGYSRRAHCALYSSGSTSMNALKHVSTTGSAHVGAPCRGRRRPPADQPSPGADVGGVSRSHRRCGKGRAHSPVQMWQG